MSSSATNVQLYGGNNGIPASVTSGGNLGSQINFDSVQNVGKIILRIGKVTRIQDIPCSMMMVYNPATNGNIWYAGFDDQAPQVGVGNPILPGEVWEKECTDANQFGFTPEVDGNAIYVIVFAVNSSSIVTPSNPPDFTNTPPTLTPFQPNVNNATNVPLMLPIEVAGSAQLDPNTVNNTTVTASPTMTATIGMDSNNPNNIIVTPTSPLTANTTYTITYGTGIADLNGNHLASNFVFTFKTVVSAVPDTTPPTLVSADPGSNAQNVNPSLVPSLVFSEAIQSTSINTHNILAFIINNDQPILNLTFTQSIDLKTIYIAGMNMVQSTSYQIQVLGGSGIGVQDLAGNYLSATYVLNFATAAPSTIPVYNVGGNTYDNIQGGSGGHIYTGILLNSNRSLLTGTQPIGYNYILKKVGTPTGTISFDWYRLDRSGEYDKFRALGTIDASTLTTTDQLITINDSGNTSSLQYNDFLTIRYSGGNSNNAVMVRVSNYDAFDGSNTCCGKVTSDNSSSIQIVTSVDVAATIVIAGS